MEDCSYEECKKLILDHLAPAPTKFTQRYKLRSCVQEGMESICNIRARLSMDIMRSVLVAVRGVLGKAKKAWTASKYQMSTST